MKKISFLITIIVSLIVFNGCSQRIRLNINEIQEIWVYEHFESRGYTTAGIARKFHELEVDNIIKFRLDNLFVDSLKDFLLNSATTRKVFQEKTGQNLVFSQFVMKDGSTCNIIINSTGIVDYFGGHTAFYFIDNERKKNKTLWTKNFFNRIYE